jgi:pimeloyl-ACP methyl ester carboxylesterase
VLLWSHLLVSVTSRVPAAVVPDLRGYGRSDKPEAVGCYRLRVMTADVLAVLADLEIDSAAERSLLAASSCQPASTSRCGWR